MLLCFLFFQKPQTCVFENMTLSRALGLTLRAGKEEWFQAQANSPLQGHNKPTRFSRTHSEHEQRGKLAEEWN